jgi:hypothetical protein
MGEKIRQHIRSNVIGYVALFVALSGTAYAADGPLAGTNTVGSADIINGEVQSPDIGTGQVTTSDLASNSVTGGRIVNGQVQSLDVGNDSIRSEDIFDGTIGSIDVGFGALRGDEIQDETLSGADVIDDGIRGEDVNESTLGRVPSAGSVANLTIVQRTGDAVAFGNQDANNGIWLSGTSTATCLPGETLVGGGGNWDNGQQAANEALAITDSWTDGTTNSWKVTGITDADNDTLRAHVLCFQGG